MTYPILLVHGLARFDFLWNNLLGIDHSRSPFLDRLHYFKGIRTMLIQKGYSTTCASLPWAGGVDKRGEALKRTVVRILQNTGASKVNLIAHSMGGLDARHMLFNDRNKDRIHRKIASVTTISTPHEGSPFADRFLERLEPLIKLLKASSLDINGFEDVGTHACKTYNTRSDVREFETSCEGTILFQTYAGRHPYQGISLFHKHSYTLIHKLEGDNDGMVSVKSAKWREHYFKGILENTEHFNEVGWMSPEQIIRGQNPRKFLKRIHEFYAELARNLP